jgi:hypothetical protein
MRVRPARRISIKETEVVADKIFTMNIDNLTSQAVAAERTYSSLIGEATISNDAKLIASAITLVGAQIATALFQSAQAAR